MYECENAQKKHLTISSLSITQRDGSKRAGRSIFSHYILKMESAVGRNSATVHPTNVVFVEKVMTSLAQCGK
jgi:mevalonate pyrophosphate decarboxylase